MTKQFLLQLAFILLACMPSFAEDAKSLPLSGTITPHGSANSFVENKGQITDQNGHIRKDIQFKLPATKGLSIFISSGHVHYQWYQPESESSEETSYHMYRMDIELIGANPGAEVIRSGIQPYYEMYYTATTGINGCRANTFSKITYADIYPNIDWVLYTKDGKFKHEFIVKKGGNAADIRIKYDGAATLKINADGSISATTPMGTITEAAPVSFTNEHVAIASKYKLTGNILTYELENYNGDITIDPVIEWGTYYAGLSDDYISSVTTDANGNSYSCGNTNSTSNIASAGAHSTTFSGSNDGFIVRLRKDGGRDWATYYGGTGDDRLFDIKLQGTKLYVCGFTSSTTGIATTGTHNGGNDIYVVELNTSGVRSWGKYYGGSAHDYANDMAIAGNGNIYICGTSSSANGIATPNTYQTYNRGGNDGIVMVLDPSGNKIMGTYIGGNDDDRLNGISIDNNGNAIVTGSTTSNLYIASNGSHQSVYGGSTDAFVSSFDDTTGYRWWTTYYGGSGTDIGNAVVCDNNGDIYVAGKTSSTSAIATAGSHQPAFANLEDGFMAKFNNNGTPVWGTYYGGASADIIKSIMINDYGNIIIGGEAISDTGIATPGTHKATKPSVIFDGFFAEFTTSGTRAWGSYFGGNANDNVSDVAISAEGGIYVVGSTKSNSGIATPGAIIPNYVSGYYGFIIRFCQKPTVTVQPADISETTGGTTQFTVDGYGNGLKYQWQADNGSGYQDINNSGQYSGTDTKTLTVSNLTLTNNNLKYRCLLSSSSCIDTTNDAKLTVTVGIDDVNKKSVKVYPNPATDIVTIASDIFIENAAVYSIAGRKLMTVNGSTRTLQLDMSNFIPGIYIIKINGEHVVRVTKQ